MLTKKQYIEKRAVLEHNHEKTVYAVQDNIDGKNVSVSSSDDYRNGYAKRIKIHKFPPRLQLVGGYRGLLYFVSQGLVRCCFYAAFRENVGIKRHIWVAMALMDITFLMNFSVAFMGEWKTVSPCH